MKKYLIKIFWMGSNNSQEIEISSENIKWTMEQYSRNREPFRWEIVKIEDH